MRQMGSPVLDSLGVPIVQAPMAGGPSTAELAIAVDRAGGLGFIAAGYLSVERLRDEIAAVRERLHRFGVNVFVSAAAPAADGAVEDYARRLVPEAERAGVELGRPRFDDDAFDAKLELLLDDPVAVVSFTFGLPSASVVERLHTAGSEVWATVTSPAEARLATAAGADVLIVQGVEAGGHRGVFADDEAQSELTLLAALQLIVAEARLPIVAAGAIMTGGGLAAVLAAGATAGQLGTAFLRSDEAGTSSAQRAATAGCGPTALTRAFSGRTARGIVNRWQREHGPHAPRAYPEVHHLTAPLRAHGRETGDADLINLWAGQAHQLAVAAEAEQIVARIAADASEAAAAAAARLSG